MTYEEFINNILDTRGRFACGEEYHERHHIVPKCMGGGNEEENLIDLFAREHFEAHRLLALENPDVRGLQFAWFNMCQIKGRVSQNRYIPTSEEYEEARIVVSQLNSGENNPNYGKHLSDNVKRQLSAYAKERWKNDEYRNKQSERGKLLVGEKNPNYGNHKLSGENNPNYGKPMPKEQKRKISIARKGKYAKGNHPRAMIVVQCNKDLEPIAIYSCSMSVSEKLHIDNSEIGKVCKGRKKTAGGYQWKYLYDQTQKDGTIIPGAITLGLITEEEALKMLEEQKDTEGESIDEV